MLIIMLDYCFQSLQVVGHGNCIHLVSEYDANPGIRFLMTMFEDDLFLSKHVAVDGGNLCCILFTRVRFSAEGTGPAGLLCY
jgi:hypothetical protein